MEENKQEDVDKLKESAYGGKMLDTKEKKKGFLAAIWESMTKTGGCCGSGESCGCSSRPGKDNAKNGKKNGGSAPCPGANSSEERKK